MGYRVESNSLGHSKQGRVIDYKSAKGMHVGGFVTNCKCLVSFNRASEFPFIIR